MKHLFTLVAIAFFCTNIHAQNIGIGTKTPDSKLQIKAASSDSVALKVSVDSSTKLKLSSNGGLSVGTPETAPANGLRVKGKIVAGDSIQSAKAIYITTVSDSVVLRAGNTTIILSANGAVKINAAGGGGITIDGGTGDVTLKGANVNINTTNNTTISSNNVSITGASGGSFTTPGTLSLSGDLATALYSNHGEVNLKGLNVNTLADSLISLNSKKTLSLIAQGGAATVTASAGPLNLSGVSATLNSNSTTTVKGVNILVQSNGPTNIKGSTILLGNGSYQPAARQGDQVVAPNGAGQIISGSSIVLIQ